MRVKSDTCWLSPYNARFDNLNQDFKLKLHDSTLRDGEQTSGVVLTSKDKIKLAAALSEAGVDRIEAGMPVVSEDDARAIGEIKKMGLTAEILSFCRARKEDIDKSLEIGVDHVCIETPAGEPRLKYQFNWTHDEVIEKSVNIVGYAKSLGLKVTFFPYDTTRAELDFLERLLTALDQHARPEGVVVVDTIGCALPQTMAFLVKEFKRMVDWSIEVHTHNDFGLGVANTLAAVTAGADTAHVCVNGLGERTGNASLAEVVMSARYLLGIKTGVITEKLTSLAGIVGETTGIPVPKNAPFVGEYAYTRETGIGINMQKEAPLVIYPVLPKIVGQTARPVLGKKSGKMSVRLRLEELGLAATDEQVAEILDAVKTQAIAKKALITDKEFDDILHELKVR
ncbi:MAG: LeuA family protein [Peptococcaceae bacterium]